MEDVIFSNLYLSETILKRLHEIGYEKPTPIQEKAIPLILQGSDILGCAQTGTGKTAAYVLPIIDILASHRTRAMMPRCLILLPTRELALQVEQSFEDYGKNAPLKTALLIGGVSAGQQEQKLAQGADVVIATPGRFLDFYGRGKLLLPDVKMLVIDEADRMLDMGFIPDVKQIVSFLPKDLQTIFLSATMPSEVQELANSLLKSPKEIKIKSEQQTGDTISQQLVCVPPHKSGDGAHKRQALRNLLTAQKIENAIVFCNRKQDVDMLQRSLARYGYKVRGLHGDLSQKTRTEALEKFKSGEVLFLIASDVAARGLDVDDLPNVINYNVPHSAEDYVHRIGRTGRAGKIGHAWTLVSPEEMKNVEAIQQKLGQKIEFLAGFSPSDAPAPADGKKTEKRPSRPKAVSKEVVSKAPEKTLEQPEKKPHEEKKPQEKKKSLPPKEEGPVVGFGSSMPSFMKIKPPV